MNCSSCRNRGGCPAPLSCQVPLDELSAGPSWPMFVTVLAFCVVSVAGAVWILV